MNQQIVEVEIIFTSLIDYNLYSQFKEKFFAEKNLKKFPDYILSHYFL